MPITIQETQTATATAARYRTITFEATWAPTENDLVVFFTRSNSVTTITTPAGWLNPLGGNTIVSDNVNSLACVCHWVTAAEAATVERTYTATNLWAGNTSGVVVALVLRGVDVADPFDLTNTAVNTATSTTGVLAGLEGDNLSAGSLIVSGIKVSGPATYTQPSGWTAQGVLDTVAVLTYNTLASPPNDVPGTNVTISTARQYASITVAFTEASSTPPPGKGGFFQLFNGPPSPVPTWDAGLNEPFGNAAATTGVTRSVIDYGATPDDPANDDRAAFTNAIAACAAGDEVFIPNGNYHLKSQPIVCKSGVIVRGESKAGVVLQMQYTAEQHSVFYIPDAATDVTIENLSIRKDSGSNFLAGIRFSSANTTASSPSVTRAVIRNVSIQGHQRFGIEANNVKHLLVDGCDISNAVALDGGGSGYGVILNGPSCHNCIVRNCTIGPVIRHALVLQQCHHCLVELCEISNCVSGMIDLHGEDEYSNEVRYNTIHDAVLNGTTISPNGGGIEIGEPPGDHDKSGPRNWIHHNTIYNCPQGVRLMNQSNYTRIEDNTIYGCDDGILIDQVSGFAITGVGYPTIKRNQISDCINGIQLIDTVLAPNVSNNQISGCGTGLLTDSSVTKYLVAGNAITANGTNLSLGGPDGTYVA